MATQTEIQTKIDNDLADDIEITAKKLRDIATLINEAVFTNSDQLQLKYVQLPLTSTQVDNWGALQYEVLAAPGAGKILWPRLAMLTITGDDFLPYTDDQGTSVHIDIGSTLVMSMPKEILTGFKFIHIESVADVDSITPLNKSDLENQPLSLKWGTSGGPITGGPRSLTLDLYYVELSTT